MFPRKRKRGTKDIPLSLSNLPIGTDVRRVIRNNRTRIVLEPLIPSQAESSTPRTDQMLPSNDILEEFSYDEPIENTDTVTVPQSWKVGLIQLFWQCTDSLEDQR